MPGTTTSGRYRSSSFEQTATRAIETAAVTRTIAGKVVTSSVARYNASRVAFPAMNCALTPAAQLKAATVRASGRVRKMFTPSPTAVAVCRGRLCAPSWLRECLSRRRQRELERFARNARHEGTNQPGEPEGDLAGERDRLALHVRAAVAFEQAPVGVQAPQVATVAADRFFVFRRRAGAFNFGNTSAEDPARRTVRRVAGKPRFVFGIDDDGYHLFHHEPQVHPKVVPLSRPQFRRRHGRGIDVGVMVVVLKQHERFVDGRARNEYHTDPVMNDTVRDVDVFSAVTCRKFLDDDRSTLHRVELQTLL